MYKRYILNEKDSLIGEILTYLEKEGKSLQYRLNIESYLNKLNIKQLKAYLSNIKPTLNPFQKVNIPIQNVLTNKDIIFNSVVKKGVSKNRKRKLLRYNTLLKPNEQIKVGFYLKNLLNTRKSIKSKVRAKAGFKVKLLINNELRTIILNNSGFNKLYSFCNGENDNKLIDNFLRKQLKTARKKYITKNTLSST